VGDLLEDWALIRRLVADGDPQRQVARDLGIARETFASSVRSERQPKYERPSQPTSYSSLEAQVRVLLAEHPTMPATVIAERVGWSGSIPWFRDNVRRAATEQRPVDPADRRFWVAGDAVQRDPWFPPQKIPLEDGTAVLLSVLVIVAAHSRLIAAWTIPTRKTEDLILESWELVRPICGTIGRWAWRSEHGKKRKRMAGTLMVARSVPHARWSPPYR
jgi:hypothetical protein